MTQRHSLPSEGCEVLEASWFGWDQTRKGSSRGAMTAIEKRPGHQRPPAAECGPLEMRRPSVNACRELSSVIDSLAMNAAQALKLEIDGTRSHRVLHFRSTTRGNGSVGRIDGGVITRTRSSRVAQLAALAVFASTSDREILRERHSPCRCQGFIPLFELTFCCAVCV